MAEIPRAALDELTRQVNGISVDAQEKVLRVLESVDWSGGEIADVRAVVSDAVRMACDAYTMASAQAAADFYDASRELCVGEALGAVPEPGYDPDATDGAIRAFTQDIVDGKPVEQFNRKVLDRVDYEMKAAAARSTISNARRDPLRPKWARVPGGAETCTFCLMLASRGFVYNSEKSAEGRYHGHPGCDCRIVCSWDADSVEGYDPQELYYEWKGRENFVIPTAKLTGYALNMDHPKGRDKAIAFRDALGFTEGDAEEIMRQVYRRVGERDPVFRGTDEYGDRYTTDMIMTGEDGKTARVVIGWIKEHGGDKMRLTSIFVAKRKG